MCVSAEIHDETGDNLGLRLHPAPNLKPGDEVTLEVAVGFGGYG